MSEAVAKKKNTAYYINSIISLIIIFGFGQIPAPEPPHPTGDEPDRYLPWSALCLDLC